MKESEPYVNYGWRVTFAGLGINLSLAIMYSWSVISKGVPESWGWSQADKSLPYAISCLVISLVMVPAGHMQDKLGPRLVATIGGLLVGLGMILASFTTTPLGFVVGFGVLTGSGIAFAYAAATPPAVKWFPAAKTGMVVGIVVSGFGVAPVYAAPLASWLIGRFGLSTAIVILGTGFLMVVTGLAQLLKTPPPGYVPPGTVLQPVAAGPQRKESYPPREMLKTWQFYTMWFMYACGAGAGLMIISKLAEIAMVQAGLEMGFVLVAALGVGNGGGRIITGILSDKIGRKATLLMCFVLQAVLILLLSQTTEGSWLANAWVLSVVSALIGANFGANLALFPSMTKDYFGLAHFGMNYGLLFTAWGFGGFLLALLAGKVYDVTGSFNFAYYSSAALLVGAAIATILVKPPYHLEEESAA
ncbi:MAG: OFA family MFS transporter [Patescibacteria group bacterium]|nr:OFA family MFS transporter [Patescibacteria group bacterium]